MFDPALLMPHTGVAKQLKADQRIELPSRCAGSVTGVPVTGQTAQKTRAFHPGNQQANGRPTAGLNQSMIQETHRVDDVRAHWRARPLSR